jgi:hypothetical protein
MWIDHREMCGYLTVKEEEVLLGRLAGWLLAWVEVLGDDDFAGL